MSLNLAQNQNTEAALLRIAAQRKLYADAKKLFALESLLATVVPVVGTGLAFVWYDIRIWFALASFFAWWAIFAVLEPTRKSLCRKAASVQELFDREVLQLPANDRLPLSIGREEIVASGTRWIGKHGDEKLRAWYPEATDVLPPRLARIVCQRSNLGWDAELRYKYATTCWALLAALFAGWISLGLAANMTVRDAVIYWLLPLTPIIYLLAKQARSHGSIAQRKSRLIVQAESVWNLALTRPNQEKKLTSLSRDLQDELFDLRCAPELIWDWLYNWRRGKAETLMQKTAADYVEEARTRTRLQ